jgi:AcrR family transcriptional regulator
MLNESETMTVPAGRLNPQERAERIMAAATELLVLHGYKRVTVEDIAHRAGIGKGTIYLHWKTREALIVTLILREALAIWRDLLQRLRADPTEIRLSRVMRSLLVIGMGRPLGKALFTGDRQLLGTLANYEPLGNKRAQKTLLGGELFGLLQSYGLVTADLALAEQQFALRATVNGFLLMTYQDPLPLEAKADALARLIERAFEPTPAPSTTALQAAAPQLIAWLEQVCQTVAQQIQELSGLS